MMIIRENKKKSADIGLKINDRFITNAAKWDIHLLGGIFLLIYFYIRAKIVLQENKIESKRSGYENPYHRRNYICK